VKQKARALCVAFVTMALCCSACETGRPTVARRNAVSTRTILTTVPATTESPTTTVRSTTTTSYFTCSGQVSTTLAVATSPDPDYSGWFDTTVSGVLTNGRNDEISNVAVQFSAESSTFDIPGGQYGGVQIDSNIVPSGASVAWTAQPPLEGMGPITSPSGITVTSISYADDTLGLDCQP
jgi:hypothetical protein